MAKRKVSNITGYTYKGGAFIVGVPARDLSVGEYKKFAKLIEEQQALTNMVLYEPVTDSAASDEEV